MALIVCHECGNKVSEKAESCPHCGNPMGNDESDSMGCGKGCGLFVIGSIAIIGFTIFIVSIIGDSNSPNHSTSTTSRSIGEVVALKHSQAPSFLAVDSKAWDKLVESVTAKDKIGTKKLMRQGEVYLIKEDKKAKVLETGFTSYKVRITEGPHRGISGWVYKEIITGK